jgi:Uma2 family endonuclease
MEALRQTQHFQKTPQPYFKNCKIDDQQTTRIISEQNYKQIQDSKHIQDIFVPEAEYWEKYYQMPDFCYEWCNGKLEEKPRADFASFQMYLWFINLLDQYLKTINEGALVGLEIGFKMTGSFGASIRKPDLALIHQSNPVQMKKEDRSYRGCFDMCIEFLSDSTIEEIRRDTVIKKVEYEQSGVKEYFILDRKHYETVFYRLSKSGVYKPIESDKHSVIQSSVLSNFQFCIDDLYTLPKDHKLRNDRVYNHYFQTDVSKEIEEAKNCAEKEKIRADAEKARADIEKTRADTEKIRADEAIEREQKLLHELKLLQQK